MVKENLIEKGTFENILEEERGPYGYLGLGLDIWSKKGPIRGEEQGLMEHPWP